VAAKTGPDSVLKHDLVFQAEESVADYTSRTKAFNYTCHRTLTRAKRTLHTVLKGDTSLRETGDAMAKGANRLQLQRCHLQKKRKENALKFFEA